MIDAPFGPPVDEIPLSRSPLTCAIAQVRFPPVVAIQGESAFVSPFQEALRADYPILRQERQLKVLIGPNGALPEDAGLVWRFEQADPDGWQVTLSTSFVALSVKRYTSRGDFVSRLTVMLHALRSWLNPAMCDRLGVRYVDRVTGRQLERIGDLVRSEVLGVADLANAVALPSGETASPKVLDPVHALSDTLFHMDGRSELRGRWGVLPAGATHDPAIEPAPERSWILDLDHYSAQPEPFDLAALIDQTSTYCDRIYRFFRWAITDDFLDTFGGHR